MKVLITGAKGFIGKNLTSMLEKLESMEMYLFDMDTDPVLLYEYTRDCDFVFHLAGVNRPQKTGEFMEGNCAFTSTLLDALKSHGNKVPILVTLSIQAEMDNHYGQSKKAGEDLVFAYGGEFGIPVYVYRLPNVFGKWCRPNYNSAVATFCHNVAHGLPIVVNDPTAQMRLVYNDDVMEELLRAMNGEANIQERFCYVKPVHQTTLGHIAELIHSFRASRQTLSIPDMGDAFTKDLYATYLSYLPEEEFRYPLKMNVDYKGTLVIGGIQAKDVEQAVELAVSMRDEPVVMAEDYADWNVSVKVIKLFKAIRIL